MGEWPQGSRVRDKVLEALAARGWLQTNDPNDEVMTDEIIRLLPDVPERSVRGALLELSNLGILHGESTMGREHHRRFWRKASDI